MIGHEAQGVNLPAGLAACLSERGHEALPMLVIPENRLAPVSAIHDVINRSGIFHSALARHAAQSCSHPQQYVNIKN